MSSSDWHTLTARLDATLTLASEPNPTQMHRAMPLGGQGAGRELG